ncbi:hypothetical protein PaeBR_02280 [Paenibacillus sp. BR2-3]|uniref:hypothetical protein n=1 Tax=Paenibacillus sp. BR2-3 TaxID=3048494 RepID=UPI0039778639
MFFTGLLINSSVGGVERTAITDFMLMSLLPILGFTYSRRSFKYWSEDSYTKMLAYLQSLPIPIAVILCKRKLQALLSFALNGILYFGLIYALSGDLRTELSPLPYVVFALTWIGYGLVMTGVYVAIEFLCSGKIYCWMTILIMALCAGASLLVKLAGGNLLFYTISYSKEYGVASPLMWGSFLAGVISIQLLAKWTMQRLKKRDLV